MGNSSASKASPQAAEQAVQAKKEYLDRKIKESGQKAGASMTAAETAPGKFIPMKIVRDESTQTAESTITQAKKVTSPSFKSHRRVLISIFAAYVAACFLFASSFTLQSVMVYLHPLRLPLGDLQDLSYMHLPNARNIDFFTEDGLLLHAYHLHPQLMHSTSDEEADRLLAHAQRIIIYFHGNGGSRGYAFRTDIVKQLAAALDAHVIAVDYRGFGDCDGWPTELGTHLDALAAVQWLDRLLAAHGRTGYLPSPSDPDSDLDPDHQGQRPHLFLYGQSLGSAVATALAHDLQGRMRSSVSGLVLDAPFSTLKDATESHPLALLFRAFPPVQRLMQDSMQIVYPTINRIGLTGTPTLLLHGEQDWQVPLVNSLRLRERALMTHRFVEVDFSACKEDEQHREEEVCEEEVLEEEEEVLDTAEEVLDTAEEVSDEEVSEAVAAVSTTAVAVTGSTSLAVLDAASAQRRARKMVCRVQPAAPTPVQVKAEVMPIQLKVFAEAGHNTVFRSKGWQETMRAFIGSAERSGPCVR